jgi:glycine cleavage system H protein
MTYPIRLKYSSEHVWVKVEGETALLGITDYMQAQLGDILYVGLPDVDRDIYAGDTFSEIESAESTFDAAIPVSGRVIAVNDDLSDYPEAINEDAYDAWIAEIELSDTSELDLLLSASEYKSSLGE